MYGMSLHRPTDNGRDELSDEFASASSSPFSPAPNLLAGSVPLQQHQLPPQFLFQPFPSQPAQPSYGFQPATFSPPFPAYSGHHLMLSNGFLPMHFVPFSHNPHHHHQQQQQQQHHHHIHPQPQQHHPALNTSLSMFEMPVCTNANGDLAAVTARRLPSSPPPPVSQSPAAPASQSGRAHHELIVENDPERLHLNVNPSEFSEPHSRSSCFVIKSYSEEDIHRAIKYSIWCSSFANNYKLNKAYTDLDGPSAASSEVSTPSSSCGTEDDRCTPAFLSDRPMVYLFFSVNGSGHFCGVARLASPLYPDVDAGVWSQSNKWRGLFKIRWLYVKDVPNAHLRHIRLPNNDNKPVTNTRDGQEVPLEQGAKVLNVIHHFQYTTTLFDDYDHYDNLEEDRKKKRGK